MTGEGRNKRQRWEGWERGEGGGVSCQHPQWQGEQEEPGAEVGGRSCKAKAQEEDWKGEGDGEGRGEGEGEGEEEGEGKHA